MRQEADERRDRPEGAGVEEIDVRAHCAEQGERDPQGEPANHQRQNARRGEAPGGREEGVEGEEQVLDLLRVRANERQSREPRALPDEERDARDLDRQHGRSQHAPEPEALDGGAERAQEEEQRHVDHFLCEHASRSGRERDRSAHGEGSEEVTGARRRDDDERPRRENRDERPPEAQPVPHRLEDDLPPEGTQKNPRRRNGEGRRDPAEPCAAHRIAEPGPEAVDEEHHHRRGRGDRHREPEPTTTATDALGRLVRRGQPLVREAAHSVGTS